MILKYKNGRNCIHGHINPDRYVKGNRCVECSNDPKIRSYRKDTDRVYANKNKLRLKTKVYGLTVEKYKEIIKIQNNCCKICLVDFNTITNRSIHIDHCHYTKKVRGILCHWCNLGIANLQHNPELIRKAALYCEE